MKESFRYKPTILANLSTRNSFVTNVSSKVRGIVLGLNFNKVTRLSLGYNWLQDNIKGIYTENNQSYETTLKLRYIATSIDCSFYKTRKVEIK